MRAELANIIQMISLWRRRKVNGVMPTRRRRVPEPPPTHWARDVVGRDVEFAVEGYFPRGVVSSIYAPRDAGKTTVAIHFLAELFGAEHPRIRSLFNSQ
jgi:hypothetical protein